MSYCPIMALHDYLTSFWVRDEIERQLDISLERVAETVSSLQERNLPEFPREIPKHLIPGWIQRRGWEGLSEDLGASRTEAEELRAKVGVFLRLGHALSTTDLQVMEEAIASSKARSLAVSDTQFKSYTARLWKDIQSRIRSLPGDLFFLNSLSNTLQGGFMVYLRRIGDIKEEALAVGPLRNRQDGEISATRISRLKAPFRYSLTQRLGAVFSSIGLPEEYEQGCQRALEEATRIRLTLERRESHD